MQRVVAPLLLLVLAGGCARYAEPVAAPASVPIRGVPRVAIVTDEAPRTDVRTVEGDDGEEIDESVVTPCGAGKTRDDASRALRGLSTKIEDLAYDADPKPLTEELVAIFDTPCFTFAKGDVREELAFANALSLKTWWADGGESWLDSYLSVADGRWTYLPPTPRHTLALDKETAKLPLAPLLCPPGTGTDCGRETVGWMRRADRLFDLQGEASSGKKDQDDCTKEAEEAEPSAKYSTFRSCLDEITVRRTALPVGRFKAPSDGWIVMRTGGRRSCSEMRAYDLVTGSAIVAATCNGTTTTKTGRVSLSSLREATWMLLLWPTAEKYVRTSSTSYQIPKEVPLRRPADEGFGIGGFGGCGTSSFTVDWSWMRDKDKTGTLSGQASGWYHVSPCGEAEGHASALMEIAHDSFEEGCAPKKGPSSIAWSKPGPAIEGGGTPALDVPEDAPLHAAIATAKPTACPAKS
jgi:hypothetical protein